MFTWNNEPKKSDKYRNEIHIVNGLNYLILTRLLLSNCNYNKKIWWDIDINGADIERERDRMEGRKNKREQNVSEKQITYFFLFEWRGGESMSQVYGNPINGFGIDLFIFDSSLFDCLFMDWIDLMCIWFDSSFCFYCLVWLGEASECWNENEIELVCWIGLRLLIGFDQYEYENAIEFNWIWVLLHKNSVAAHEIILMIYCNRANRLTVTTPCRVYFVDAT